MSKGNTFENDLLQLIFNAVDIANIAVSSGVTPELSTATAITED